MQCAYEFSFTTFVKGAPSRQSIPPNTPNSDQLLCIVFHNSERDYSGQYVEGLPFVHYMEQLEGDLREY
jgi:hypothetical protein